ncbi:hypothetical protein [Saccharothrix xinjiangensis]|uniref:HEAT repeat protein n=1 Tax=Saccharothrix xinjiangensis TaxID=204798 RepID=A0ABV9XSZ9_9PSEU
MHLHASADRGAQIFQSAGPQTIYGREVLHDEPFPQEELRIALDGFVEPPGLGSARDKLANRGVVVLVAPRGDGASTAALHLLVEHHETDADQAVDHQPAWQRLANEAGPRLLTADWATPNAHRIPRRPDTGYLLDLTAEEEDIKTEFRRALVRLGRELRGLRSCLAVVVTPDQWGEVKQDPELDSITAQLKPPDPVRLAQRHIEFVHRRRDRLRRLQDAQVALTSHMRPRVAAAIAAVLAIADEAEVAPGLNAVLEWPDYLAARFDTEVDPKQRALLWSLAVLDGAPKRVIFNAARTLMGQVNLKTDHATTLAGPDLSSHLRKLEAAVSEELVSLNAVRPGLSPVVLGHIWREYDDLRDVMLDWLLTIGGPNGAAAHHGGQVVRALFVLARQDPNAQVLRLLGSRIEQGKRLALIVDLLHETAIEGEIARAARDLLLDWAKGNDEKLHEVVARVCGGRFGHVLPERALVRLKWLFTRTQPKSRRHAADAIRSLLVHDAGLDVAVLNTVVDWLRSGHQAGLPAFAQTMTITEQSLPCIRALLDPLHDPDGGVSTALVEGWSLLLSATPQDQSEQLQALRSWFDAADNGHLPVDRVTAVLQAAAGASLGDSSTVKLLLQARDLEQERRSSTETGLITWLFDHINTFNRTPRHDAPPVAAPPADEFPR